jgi:hypothetical protein
MSAEVHHETVPDLRMNADLEARYVWHQLIFHNTVLAGGPID